MKRLWERFITWLTGPEEEEEEDWSRNVEMDDYNWFKFQSYL
jgi:hypothetical protein